MKSRARRAHLLFKQRREGSRIEVLYHLDHEANRVLKIVDVHDAGVAVYVTYGDRNR